MGKLPADIDEAIKAVAVAAYLHGLEVGDGTGPENEAAAIQRADAARLALDTAILAHLGRAALSEASRGQTEGG